MDTNILEIGQGSGNYRKRTIQRQQSTYPHAKQHRMNSDVMWNSQRRSDQPRRGDNINQHARNDQLDPQAQGRRTRCPRCNNFFHRNLQCPALSRTCDVCGKRGHFAKACRSGPRTGRPKAVRLISEQPDAESSGDENMDYKKQVKQG